MLVERSKKGAERGDSLLKAASLQTPLGPMLAMGDDHALYVLSFAESQDVMQDAKRYQPKRQVNIVPGMSLSIQSIDSELQQYFKTGVRTFKTPLKPLGTDFQKTVWQALRTIPSGETRSYAEMATAIGKPTAYRAVARANATNPIAIVIPCHCVINHNGNLGGYAGGLDKKVWLLEHEGSRQDSL